MTRKMREQTIAIDQLGDFIRNERRRKGWSKATLAERADTEESVISMYELYGTRPRLDSFERLVSALGFEIVLREVKDDGCD